APRRDAGWWLIVTLTALDVAVLAWLLIRMRSTRPALAAAFHQGYGPAAEPDWTRAPWWRVVLVPFISWRPDVRRIRNRRYGTDSRYQRLDVYLSRRHRPDRGAPVLVYFHPGGFVMGSKMLGSHPLFYRLAADGWVCMSAD